MTSSHTPRVKHGDRAPVRARRVLGKVRRATCLTIGALALSAAVLSPTALASADLWTWGPGVGGFARAQVADVGTGPTAKVESILFTSARYDRGNRCGTGLSVWYTRPNGARGNYYVTRGGCTPGPLFWFTAGITARRGTTVNVTYRAEWQWYSGPSFRVG